MTQAALKQNYLQLTSDLKKVKNTLALAASLPCFLRERVTLEQAKEGIQTNLETRSNRFLDLARARIYECPASPYLRLLKHAGCDFSDLRAHVHSHGLESTLERLAAEGVYLTSDEYKGKKEVIRGGLSFKVCPDDFELPHSSPGFLTQSSGTNNQPVRSLSPLEWIGLRTLATGVFFFAHNLFSYSHALYDAILPASSINHLLVNAKLGKRTDRWFARTIPFNNRLEGWYYQSATHLIVQLGKWFGPGFPTPELLGADDTDRIVSWIAEQKRLDKNSYLTTVASNAARVARKAWQMGLSLEGTKFNVAGEPFTEEKEKAIQKVGATTTSRYSYGGQVSVGCGCGHPSYRDEVHVNQHLLALIGHPRPLTGVDTVIHPLCLTTLDPAAPRLLLNVQNGDYVKLEERDCGCALQQVGLTLHLHHIRSFEKLTSEGMNYFYGDLYELFEKALPGEFGGSPGDYQLVEEEDSNGQTRLTLLVHPGIGQLDEKRVLARLHAAFADGSRGNRFMTGVWQNAGTFRMRREVPYASPRGKVLPLHIRRHQPSSDSEPASLAG
ncbi:MAG: hypothetical protein WD688_02960 [Candidatus Binatia bacterium]